MNNIFNLRRFGLYAQKELRENWKALALGIIALIAGNLYVIFSEWNYIIHDPYFDNPGYKIDPYLSLSISIGLATWIVSSYVFKDFAIKNKTLAYLTLPASTFEKFLLAWLMAVPFTILCSYVIWKISWAIFIGFLNQNYPQYNILDTNNYDPYISVFIITASGVYMIGALMLKRLSLLKTMGLLTIAGWLVYGLLTQWLGKVWFDNANIGFATPVPWLRPKLLEIYSPFHTPNYYDISTTYEPIYQFWWVACLPLILWTIAYLKIKEKEI